MSKDNSKHDNETLEINDDFLKRVSELLKRAGIRNGITEAYSPDIGDTEDKEEEPEHMEEFPLPPDSGSRRFLTLLNLRRNYPELYKKVCNRLFGTTVQDCPGVEGPLGEDPADSIPSTKINQL